jgi:tetratricopeptide (TPR) repeat protein
VLRAAVSALQVVIAQQEQAGVFLLAFSALAALRGALAPVLDARSEGLLLAQQGRVARQLGAMASAAELYDAAVRAGRAARAPDVAARALIGGGVLASMRGNYPEARDLFRRGLTAAERAGAEEHRRAGHHGLLVAALAAGDVETALTHGWAAFRETPADSPDQRAEMLVNLGDVSRHAGEYRATLGACLTALELTDTPRIRLPALGTAALAAAQLGEANLLTFFAREVLRTVNRSGQPFEAARALVAVAQAYMHTDAATAAQFAQRAESLAIVGQFHEVTALVESVRKTLQQSFTCRAVQGPPTGSWSAKARTILMSLERMPADAGVAERGACLAS